MDGWLQFLKDQGIATSIVAIILWWFHKHGWPFIKRRIEVSDDQRENMTTAIKDNSDAVRQLASRMETVGHAVTELRNDVTRQKRTVKPKR